MRKFYAILSFALLASIEVFSFDFHADVFQTHVQLQWANPVSKEADHFELERRSRGGDFKTIALILSDVDASDALYAYKDKLTGADQHLYYRLHIYYADGTDVYSEILSVALNEGNQEMLKISTDPSARKLLLELPAEKGSYLFRIYNMNGQLLDTRRSEAGCPEFATDKLTAGKYFMEAFHPVTGKRFFGTFSL